MARGRASRIRGCLYIAAMAGAACIIIGAIQLLSRPWLLIIAGFFILIVVSCFDEVLDDSSQS